jgi:hypothetical protein
VPTILIWSDMVPVQTVVIARLDPVIHPTNKSSYPAEAGYPVRCGFSIQSLTFLEYWITRLRG